MKTKRRTFLMSMAVLPCAVRAANESIADEQVASRLLGSWLVSAGQMSIVFSLEPGGQTLVLFDENGVMQFAAMHACGNMNGRRTAGVAVTRQG